MWWRSLKIGPIHCLCEGDSETNNQASDNQNHMASSSASAKKSEEELTDSVRVLCWIMTSPENHKTRAVHVKTTWGRRCNKLLFFSSEANQELGSIGLDAEEGRDNLWAKTRLAFKYVYQHHKDEADWFLKADDDTYVIVENLRFLLKDKNCSEPLFFGHKLKSDFVKQGFFSGGAGYVLSKEALRRFVEKGMEDPELCAAGSEGAEGEDVELGLNLDGWYLLNTFYEEDKGFGRLSDYAISFHYVPPKTMYLLEYLIYHLRPFGLDPSSHPKDNEIDLPNL